MIAPSEFCDVNGELLRCRFHQMHKSEGFVNYTTFSLWDTYRAAQPLMTLIHPEKVPDIVNSHAAYLPAAGQVAGMAPHGLRNRLYGR